jgi:hypothetical protein
MKTIATDHPQRIIHIPATLLPKEDRDCWGEKQGIGGESLWQIIRKQKARKPERRCFVTPALLLSDFPTY